jgi:hypothetical protein
MPGNSFALHLSDKFRVHSEKPNTPHPPGRGSSQLTELQRYDKFVFDINNENYPFLGRDSVNQIKFSIKKHHL